MKKNELSWMIGGAQGSGVDSSANTFLKTCASGGLYVFGKREYHSNIKGAHSYFQVCVSEKEIRSHVDEVDLLATFDKETVLLHKDEIVPNGGLIYDPQLIKEEEIGRSDIKLYPIHYADIIKKIGEEFERHDLAKLNIMRNVISVAASFGLLGFEFTLLAKTIEGVFKGKKSDVAKMNIVAAERVYKEMQEQYGISLGISLSPVPCSEKRIMMQGTIATALGKIAAGCRFQSYYPITPASEESEFLEQHSEFGTVVVQCEDEIAAVLMAEGAALTGVRSSTSTSGPGFSLMGEGLGWAGINEVPVVIFNYQRGGPATGLPTRHEQSDLKCAMYSTHGEFPRMVMAPGDLYEYFYDAIDAFNYAERYQTPVIVLCDKALSNSSQVVSWYKYDNIRIDRGMVVSNADLLKSLNGGMYKRFVISDNGISPRPLLGQRGGIYWNTGDEHDEYGHICEESDNRIYMMDKRMRKLETADCEIPMDKKAKLYGPPDAPVTLVSWGSTKGAILDAMELLEADGIKVDFLQIRLMQPFPKKYVTDVLSKTSSKILIEMNYTGQLGDIIREHTGIELENQILKFNGRAMSRGEVYNAVKQIIKQKEQKVVLSYGV